MKIYAETPRLILREILPEDKYGFYDMDSNPEVVKYLGKITLKSEDEALAKINIIRQQYIDLGIGRWAIIEKESNEFVGWTGLKLIKEIRNNRTDYYDIGYRLRQKFWGKGYATESAIASLKYAFEVLGLMEIYGTADPENIGSNKILQKIGLKYFETSQEEDGELLNWYKIEKETEKTRRIPKRLQ
jgi:[ribosomal protein S5]-alanine N-acetyltransferase